jgi:hypothetical protein
MICANPSKLWLGAFEMNGPSAPQEVVLSYASKDHARNLLAAVSNELANAAQDCGGIQVLISSLLDKTDHPDLVAEFHMIQDLDRVNQTLADLALLVQSVAQSLAQGEFHLEAIAHDVKLSSLRSRLFPSLVSSDDQPSEQVTFF